MAACKYPLALETKNRQFITARGSYSRDVCMSVLELDLDDLSWIPCT